MFVSRLRTVALTCCLLSPLVAAAGPSYSNLYVFGDSLSDGGSDYALSSSLAAVTGGAFPLTPGAPGDYQGRFGNGKVAVDVLANALGVPLTAHYRTPPFLGGATGGNNYAQGGATSGLVNASLPGTLTLNGTPVSTGFKGLLGELADYTATTSRADPNALYVVWSGANDFIHFGSAGTAPACTGAGSAAAMAICTAVTNVTSAVVTLASMGATHILVPNLPDLGETAQSIAAGPAAVAQGHAISVAYDAGLATSLGRLQALFPGEIVPFDLFGLFNQVLADPLAYGFSNTTMSCLNGSAADASSTPTAACAMAGPDHYLFWDDIHPTAAAQLIIGQRLAAAVGVPEPETLALAGLGLAAMLTVRRRRRT